MQTQDCGKNFKVISGFVFKNRQNVFELGLSDSLGKLTKESVMQRMGSLKMKNKKSSNHHHSHVFHSFWKLN